METINKFTNKELNQIISSYNLGDLVSKKELSEGSVQENILIKTTKDSLVLKHYKNRTIEYVKFETRLVQHLNKKGYSCPKIYKNKKGKLLTIRNKKAIVLFEFIEANHKKKLSKNEYEQLIKKIAELHSITKNLRIKGEENRWNYNIDFCKEYLEKRSEQYRKARQEKKKNWIIKQLKELELPDSLPKGIVHGDLHYSNIYFKGRKINALIDFDDANYSYLLFDLICLIDNQSNNFLDKEYFKILKKVIKVYRNIRDLTDEEKWHLYDVIILSILIDSFWFFKRGKFPNFKEKSKVDKLKKMGRIEFNEKIFK